MRNWLVLLVVLGCPVTLLAQEPPPGFQRLWNGRDLSGWQFRNCTDKDWVMEEGTLSTLKGGTRNTAWLLTEAQYDDFELQLEYLLTKGADSGVAIRAAPTGAPHLTGIEIQLADDAAFPKAKPQETTGALWGVKAPEKNAAKPAGEWNQLHLTVQEYKLKVVLNGITVQDVDLSEVHQQKGQGARPDGLVREVGHLGLQTQ